VDDRVRGWRLFLIALAACGPREPMPIVGTSSVGASGSASAADAAAPVPAALPSDFRTSFTRVGRARFVSRGHLDDRFAVDVYANAGAMSAFKSDVVSFPPGAMLVKEQFDKTVAGDRPAGILAMEKREAGFDPDNGDWRWIVVSAKGEIVKEGKIEQCAACHRESKHDFVFRVE
jgi:hypothetical protein